MEGQISEHFFKNLEYIQIAKWDTGLRNHQK